MVSDYKEGCIKAKEVKRGIKDQRRVGGKNKRDRPITLYYTYTKEDWMSKLLYKNGKWLKWGKYRTMVEAETAMDNLKRKHNNFWHFKIESEETK